GKAGPRKTAKNRMAGTGPTKPLPVSSRSRPGHASYFPAPTKANYRCRRAWRWWMLRLTPAAFFVVEEEIIVMSNASDNGVISKESAAIGCDGIGVAS